VKDTGVGIAPEVLPRVWDLFVQGDRDLDRAHGGLGIGLTVARRLVELHGGRIEAHSEGLGKGTEFVVNLRTLQMTTEEVPVHVTPPALPQRTAEILLVEDNVDAAESLAMLLEALGHRVRSVSDGLAALEAAGADRPEVMLVDIGLPGIDGYEVARRIRRHPDLKEVTLVALTGYGREDDERKAMAAGFDVHLTKPVDPDALQGLIGRLTKPAAANAPTIH
jgi:two-component system CheB/CheR fusion protein